MSKISLLCIPYSGGSMYSFAPLFKYNSSNINPVVFELPGRGARSDEKLCDDINTIEDDIFQKALKHTNGVYAIYGHSLGGLLAYLLTKRIIKNDLKRPIHLFITGTTGPSASRDKNIHLLDKPAFLKKIRSYKGMPDEIIDSEEIMNYFEPILRSDFKVSETFVYEESEPFNIPISVIIGDEEDMEFADVEKWKVESTAEVEITTISGNHFFIFSQAEFVMKFIENKIKKSLDRASL